MPDNRRQKLKATRGEAVARTYGSWLEMRRRVARPDPRRKNDAYAGIKISDRWSKFEVFLTDMGTRPDGMTLDRINPRGNYEPSNCRWADAITQSRNRTYCALSEKAAAEIRELYARGLSQQVIGDLFNCSQRQISNVVRELAWAETGRVQIGRSTALVSRPSGNEGQTNG
ncbi:MAG: hypothetical protein JJ869_22030 [Marivita sp.]|uniref:hypothetical protein n=1 Tax=Marivita sp. TaxID=2003365 RepID=UPI001B06B4A1|nr:hypothetical protein [Marivita sp.]MBO6886231.1 hypothetical protein [Marivita sp.]